MPTWALGPLVVAGIGVFAWALKRVVASVIDERVMPAVAKIHERVDEHTVEELRVTQQIQRELTAIRSDVSYIAGDLKLRLPSGNGR